MSTHANAPLTPEGRRRLWGVGKNAVTSRRVLGRREPERPVSSLDLARREPRGIADIGLLP
jgi:hypothetical protein